MSRILAIDLGKIKSVSCLLTVQSPAGVFATHQTSPAVFAELLEQTHPDVVVIEVGSLSGWVCDLCRELGIAVKVANTNDARWQWRQIKRKTDRDDAFRLARMQQQATLPTVHMPTRPTRQWRCLIEYRAALVRRRTAIRNTIHAILAREGMALPATGGAGWTQRRMAQLQETAQGLEENPAGELWRGVLGLELNGLNALQEQIDAVQQKLDQMGQDHASVRLLQTIPGVGPRLSELIVAVIDDPHRFASGRQVGAYAGLVPRQFESGQSSRQGRITRRGNPLLRALLTEVAWLMRRHNPQFAAVFEKVTHGSQTRRKIAIVATARRLLITCWAMLRDQTAWRRAEPKQNAGSLAAAAAV